MNQLTRVEFGSLPREPIRLALCEWLRRHGIDPNNVAVPGWIHRQIDERRVRFLGYQEDYRTAPLPRDGDPTEIQWVQLEAPPLPLPDVVDEAWLP